MTRLDYWLMPALAKSEAKVLRMFKADDGRDVLVLDSTIFYAQGGGQPADQGSIRSEVRDQRAEFFGEFLVEDVRHVEGDVYHYGAYSEGQFEVGQTVMLNIDWERRSLNTRLHSAAHLLDALMRQSYPSCKPIKSYHFPEGPYVEYQCAEVLDLEKMKELLSLEFVKHQVQTTPTTVDLTNPSRRVVTLYLPEPHAIPCGGTHVNTVAEIGPIQIRKIKLKNGICRISYALI